MSKSKKEPKKASEMTTEELAKRVFPKEALDQLKGLTHDAKPSKKQGN